MLKHHQNYYIMQHFPSNANDIKKTEFFPNEFTLILCNNFYLEIHDVWGYLSGTWEDTSQAVRDPLRWGVMPPQAGHSCVSAEGRAGA